MIYHRSLMQNLNSFCCNMRSTTNSEWYHISWCCNTMWDFANDTFGRILLKKYLDTYLIISTYAYCILQCTVDFLSTRSPLKNMVLSQGNECIKYALVKFSWWITRLLRILCVHYMEIEFWMKANYSHWSWVLCGFQSVTKAVSELLCVYLCKSWLI